MSDTSPIIPARATPVRRRNDQAPALDSPAPAQRQHVGRGADRLELSDRAVLLSRAPDLPAARADLVQRVRSEIDTGVYDSPKKLDLAIEALVSELTGKG